MRTDHLSNQLAAMIEASLQRESCEKCPDHVLAALKKMADIPYHLQLNSRHLLIQTENRGHQVPLLDPILRKLRISHCIWNQLLTTVESLGLELFLVTKQESLGLLLDDIVTEVCNHIAARASDLVSLRAQLARSQAKLEQGNQDLQLSRENNRALESNTCRDLQLVLEISQRIEQPQVQQDVRDAVQEALNTIGVQVLWEIPAGDDGHYFAVREAEPGSVTRVIRPCLTKDGEVVHQGTAALMAMAEEDLADE